MRWTTHKLGGSILDDSIAYRRATELIEQPEDARAAVVVSAAAGVTDALIDCVTRGRPGDEHASSQLALIGRRQRELAEELLSGDALDVLLSQLEEELEELGLALAKGAPVDVAAASGLGEVWSARLLTAYLTEQGASAAFLDAREVLIVDDAALAPVLDFDQSKERLQLWLAVHEEQVVVITGYIASDAKGRPMTLGRNGSDYSASLFATLFGSSEIVIWTDVDGMMTADPALVPHAHVLSEISYDEAMELAYFGASVLHPATMTPAVRSGIPIVIRNARHPEMPGTLIHPGAGGGGPVRGFATIPEIALLNLEGTSMVNVPGIARRLFEALSAAGISVVMISQASSEHSICFVVPMRESHAAARAAEEAFRVEHDHGRIKGIEVVPDCAILAAVGDGMSGTPGIAARLFGALASANVNVKAIAQGSSERNISIVIDGADTSRALRAAHAGFYLSPQTLSIGVIGPGHVGGALLDQIAGQAPWLRDVHDVDLRVRAVATSSRMVVNDDKIDLTRWKTLNTDPSATAPTDLGLFTAAIHNETVPHSVIIDCTASTEVSEHYAEWLASGIHVITPNKKAGSGPLDEYRQLKRGARWAGAHFLYETTVGAALPIIQTLRDLVSTGDRVHRIEGILSGTLSYLFNSFDGSVPFSHIVRTAREQGFTEPDPREDLSGTDVARKVVILAREMGVDLELADVSVEGLIPKGLEGGSVEEFLDRLASHDGEMLALYRDAAERGEVVRFVGTVDPKEGCAVSLRAYRSDHPFARIQLTDNIVMFHTDRYDQNPLVVQGPGAGPGVTAGGVFADLLRLANYLGATL